ncbi:MAG: glycosyltransferase family 39 protein [Rhodanobacteraceae bacterium]
MAIYAPALSSYFVLDDFGLLAYSRMLGNPLPIFVHDHFPGSLFFRPLTMAFWWLTVALFGTASMPQYVCNLALHLAVTAALGAVAFELTRARAAAFLAALIFALHPIGIGTALWLSDRFDLLASLFSLLAIFTASRYRRDERTGHLVATLLLSLAALLSKETGLVVIAPIALLWLWPRAEDRRVWTRPRIAFFGLALLAITWLASRAWLLQGPGATLLLKDAPLIEIIAQGFIRWLQGYVRLLAFWPRLSSTERAFVGAGSLAWLLLAFVAVREVWRQRRDGHTPALILAAIALLLVPGFVQAPTTRVSSIVLGAADSAWPVAFAARFYYLSLCGFGLLLAALGSLLWRTQSAVARGAWRALAIAATVSIMWPMALVAHQLARQFHAGSLPAKVAADAAVAAIEKTPLPPSDCQVYLLGIDPSLRWFFIPFADSIVKSQMPELARVRDCLIQGESTPWFHLVERGALVPKDAAPMLPAYDHGKRIPWLEIGDIEAAYLNLFPGLDARAMHNAIFLAWRDGRFVDVSAAVRSGQQEVHFHCVRPEQQCDCPGQACPGGLRQNDSIGHD